MYGVYRLSSMIYIRSSAKDRVAAAGWLDPTMMMREEILRDILTGLPRAEKDNERLG